MLAFYDAIMGIAVFIPCFILGLQLLLDSMHTSGRERTTALFGCLTGVLIGFGFLMYSFQVVLQPMAALFLLLQWTLNGIGTFFLVYWVTLATHPTFFDTRKWVAVLPVILSSLFIGLLFIGIMGGTTTIDLTTPIGMAFGLVAIVGCILYAGVVPTIAYVPYMRSEGVKGTKEASKVRLVLLGFLLYFLALFFNNFVNLAPAGFEMIATALYGVMALGWWLIWIGYRLWQ